MRAGPHPCVILAAVLFGCGGCGSAAPGGDDPAGGGSAADDPARPDTCPATATAPSPLPGVRPEQRTLAYWLGRVADQGDLDEPLLSPAAITDHNRALALPFEERPLGHADLLAPIDRDFLLLEVTERVDFMREKLERGGYLTRDGERASAEQIAPFAAPVSLPALAPEIRIARDLVPLRCGPSAESFYTESMDLRFDRGACSTARAGEPVQVLGRWSNGMLLARTPYALGWISPDAPLSEPAEEGRVRAALAHAPRTLTRRAVLEAAFAMLDTPYGWGGMGGGRDCSRFLMDVMGTFGIELPRHSGRQARAGTFSVDVEGVTDEREKLLLIDTAARRGIVLLHFPGHIMLYLGRTETGVPMVLHAFAEYVVPCEGVTLSDGSPGETLRTVDRITVSDLSLGRGSSRRSFLERITRVTVLGQVPGPALLGAADLRAAAPVHMPEPSVCEDTDEVAMFRSPDSPNSQQPLRVIVTSSRELGPVELVLVDPHGVQHRAETHRLGGPPFTWWVQVDAPERGRWTAAIGDGSRVDACEAFTVAPQRPGRANRSPFAWEPRWRWETDTDNLYAAWVEQLFDYPPDEDLTWPNLQTLLRDRDRNLLYDHLSRNEDEGIRLEPDCADLPYFLRAYFSWKLALPFAFRRCSRGAAGRPPSCGEPNTNLVAREDWDDVRSFTEYVRTVRDGVHSASARTVPRDDRTDVYPVALTHEALRPGTVYADPYGHLLVVADWVPQGATRYGVLMGADAQPDGTIGRRRFWRGSFLFTPETTDVGAGFKAWRPLVFDRPSGTMRALDNDDLARSTVHAPYSAEQYRGTMDDFYDRMEALINPRPLEPAAMMRSLADALEESIARRIVSIDNGIEYMNGRGWPTVPMPTGHDIFETAGAWEDYSTPSRDMRLLISVDAVLGFPAAVERAPARYGLTPADASTMATRLREQLSEDLAGRRFRYMRSDGSPQELTLADVVDRATGFEMAYNPNDCIEVRWAAPEGSAEISTCRRHAPRDQRARMESYRSWFHTRHRPPR